MRSGISNSELKAELIKLWQVRDDRYSDERTEQTVKIDNEKDKYELYRRIKSKYVDEKHLTPKSSNRGDFYV